jgi:hypothetical protein
MQIKVLIGACRVACSGTVGGSWNYFDFFSNTDFDRKQNYSGLLSTSQNSAHMQILEKDNEFR